MQHLVRYVSERAFVSHELKTRIERDFELVNVPKGHVLLAEGRRADYLYFIEDGLLTNYYFLANGKQVNSWFYAEHQFVTAWSSFFQQKASFEAIEALEDSRIYRISYAKYQKMIADFPAFGNFSRLLAEEMLSFLDEYSKGWSFLSAREKYQRVTTYFPDIELRVKLGLLSSFLGISQETLSRLRAGK
ncbi:MAG: Crp/Fnr family transcriptional regulator [Bacteroidota bacterium]